MNNSFNRHDNWSTPPELYSKLDKEFQFDKFDPCPLNENPEIDGLAMDWGDQVIFVNPPYSRLKSTKKDGIGWVEKAHNACQKGATVIMLIPARTDTQWFHDIILENNYEVRVIRGRLKFSNSKYSAPHPSIIVVFRI